MSVLTKIESGISKMFPDLKYEQHHQDANGELGLDISKPMIPYIEILDIAPNVYLSARAARICINKKPPKDTKDQLKYVEKIVGMGHDSVIEHTNIIALVSIKRDELDENLLEVLANSKYLNVVVKMTGTKINFLIGGSIRAYLHVLRESSVYNTTSYIISKILYQSVEKELLRSGINDGILDEDHCTYLPNAELKLERSKMTQFKNEEEKNSPKAQINDNYDAVAVSENEDIKEKPGKVSDLIYKTDVDAIVQEVLSYGFTRRDVYKVSTITFVFHDISRSCANQLVRHRNGVTQESQRYVTADYTNEDDFVNPIDMQLNSRYKDLDKNVKDAIDKINVFSNYKYLINSSILKEDARAWLPMNVKTKIMMTFTYWTFGKFLSLRLNKAAQLEIRKMAAEAAHHIFTSDDDIEQFISEVNKYGFKESEEIIPVVDEITYDKESIDLLKIDDEAKAQELIDKNKEYKKIGE